MKNALDWIKSNPISTASIAVAFLGVVVFLFVLFVQAPALRARVIEDNSKQANDLKTLTTGKVELPNPDPNAPQLVINGLVINQEMVDFVIGVNEQVAGQSTLIKSRTESINARNHREFTFDGGALFGRDTEPTDSQRVAGSQDYRNSFDAMFMEGHDALHMPKLLVGMPPRPRDVNEAMVQTLVDYLQSVGASATSDLSQNQAEVLYKLQQVAVMNLLAGQAENIQLYADTLPLPIEEEDEDGLQGENPAARQVLTGMDRYSNEYPFEVAPWAFAAEPASLDELWEGQVQIWITRDLMQAIRVTNGTATPSPDGSTVYTPQAVLTAPVKRLLRLEIIPGYVGLHSGGGVNSASGASGGNRSVGNRSGTGNRPTGGLGPGGPGGLGGPGMMEPGMNGPGVPSPGAVRPGSGSATNTPATPEAEVSEVYGEPSIDTLPTPQQPIVDSFFFGPTGRYSNSVFDVRHARLVIHIKWSEIAAFEDTLRQINFMTVIDKTITDVDEYEALASGYVYGTDDVVEVELIIETLWYRSWTADLMPQIVRDALLVPDEPDTLN